MINAALLASIPFWIVAAFMLFATIVAPLTRAPGETTDDLIGQFFIFLILTGVSAAVATLVMHL